MDTPRSHRASGSYVALALSLGAQVLAVFLLVQAWYAHTHALRLDGPWISTKTELARPVPGSFSFVKERQALSGGRLNLHAWAGFHEVVSRREFADVRRVEFDFGLGRNAYLVGLFNRLADGGWHGVRLSNHPNHPSAFLEIAPDGEFRGKSALQVEFAPGQRYSVRLESSGEAVSIVVDGRSAGSFALPAVARTAIGFRGGYYPAVVDDVRVTLADGQIIEETFDARSERRRTFVSAALSAAGVTLLLFFALRRRQRKSGWPLGFHFLGASLVLLAVAGMLVVSAKLVSSRYPALGQERLQTEEEFREGSLELTRAEIKSRYPDRPAADVDRILLVGSSQTWGQGATHDEDVLSVVVEQRLNAALAESGTSRRVECINAAAPGSRARGLLAALTEEWLALEPRIVVINLSSNDMPTGPEFAGHIREMVDRVVQTGARPVLVKEAHSHSAVPERLKRRHRDIDAVASVTGAALFDLHAYLATKDDDGFLWWDMVHLTSLGQRLAGEALAQRLGPLVLAPEAG